MQRRDLLRAGGAAGATLPFLPTAGGAAETQADSEVDAEPDGYEPIGRIDVNGAAEAVVGDDGDTAYVAATTGFVTVDISDPSEPEILAERLSLEVDGAPFTEILDVKVDGDRLAVVGPANRISRNAFYGFELYDVSDPADPAPVGDPYETGFHIHNCFLADGLLYVVANGEEANPLVIFDVGDDDPTEIGRWSLLEHEPGWEEIAWQARYLHDVYVQDGIAYLPYWNAGTYLIDVGDPADPEFVSRVSETDLETQRQLGDREAQMGLPGNDHYSAVDDAGDLLAVGREAWATGGEEPDGPGGIDLYDVSDPSEPEFRASIDAPESEDATYYGGMWTTAHNFELRDGRLYSSWYQGGVRIHDVSDPSDPAEVAYWRNSDSAGFFTARVADSETIVASSTPLIPNADTAGALYTLPADADTGGEGLLESMPGFTGVAGVAGGAVALEWLRRRHDDAR